MNRFGELPASGKRAFPFPLLSHYTSGVHFPRRQLSWRSATVAAARSGRISAWLCRPGSATPFLPDRSVLP